MLIDLQEVQTHCGNQEGEAAAHDGHLRADDQPGEAAGAGEKPVEGRSPTTATSDQDIDGVPAAQPAVAGRHCQVLRLEGDCERAAPLQLRQERSVRHEEEGEELGGECVSERDPTSKRVPKEGESNAMMMFAENRDNAVPKLSFYLRLSVR